MPGRWESGSTSSSDGGMTAAPTDDSLPSDASDDNALLDLDPSSPLFGATLVIRATYLVCHRLISSWKADLLVSLAALEFLASLAKLKVLRPTSERVRCVRWICEYIGVQCGRPPPAHSRDLHSGVVAAYACLAIWLTSTPPHSSSSCATDLLQDVACRASLLDVIELGISGTKSQIKPGDTMKMKDDKELKPVSMRVRDAAESLLMLIMEQVGVSRMAAGGWSLLEETSLSQHCSAPFFRNFLMDDNIVLSLLEEPLGNRENPQPTITVLVRWAFGRHVWSLGSRSASRSAGVRRRTLRCGVKAPRPVPIQDVPSAPPPACILLEHGPPTAADASFPSLETVLHQLNNPDALKFFRSLESQAEIEKDIRESEVVVESDEYVQPQPAQEFQTARMFLSQFGFLDHTEKENGHCRLHALSDGPGLEAALKRLDACNGPRSHLTAHLFCARAGVRCVQDIVRAPHKASTVTPAFLQLLAGLGNPVEVKSHPGWCGRPRAPKTDISQEKKQRGEEEEESMHGGSLYDGKRQVLYWSDATSEMAFIVPTDRDAKKTEQQDDLVETWNKMDIDGSCLSNSKSSMEPSWPTGALLAATNSNNFPPIYERSCSESSNASPPVERDKSPFSERHRAFSLELEKSSPNANFHPTGSGRRSRQYTVKILIVWLEDFEDHQHISVDDLLRYTDTGEVWRRLDVCVLWCARLRSGLVRVAAPTETLSPAGPLAPGALLSPSALPDCLRQTVLNAARRRRLHDDSFQPPHVRRRHIIQEIAQEFRRDLSEAELITSLFYSPPSKRTSSARRHFNEENTNYSSSS